MAWVNNPPITAAAVKAKTAETTTSTATTPAAVADVAPTGENGKTVVEDYDLADDDEARWLAE